MSEDTSEERKSESKRRFSFSKLKVDRKFLSITALLVLSVVALAFSTRYLFDSNIEDWVVTQGVFEGEKGSLHAKTSFDNWAYHESFAAYGEWNWDLRYYGSGSASITFIGLNKDPETNERTPQGYKLAFEIGQNLTLRRLNSLYSETIIGSRYFTPVAGANYEVRITRDMNNTFEVFVNDVSMINATDDTYTTSEVLELVWSNIQELNWIITTDTVGENSWSDYFTGLPSAKSNNLSTRIALYIPFVALGLIIVLFVGRVFFAQGKGGVSYIFPLVLAIIIGLGYGLLVDLLRENIPRFEPTPTPTETPTGPTATNTTGIPSNVTSTPTGNQTIPFPSSNTTNGGNGGFFGVPPEIISNVLLAGSGVFLIIAIIAIGRDFFKKRDDEFHEQILDKDRRWLPSASATDHRKRVIRAYHKTSYDLIDRGAKSERSMTPGDFEESVEERFELPNDSMEKLTDLYEEARFSEHEMREKESKKAEKYYNKITKKARKEEKKSAKSIEGQSSEDSAEDEK